MNDARTRYRTNVMAGDPPDEVLPAAHEYIKTLEAEAERLRAQVWEFRDTILGLHYAEYDYGVDSVEWKAKYQETFKLAVAATEREGALIVNLLRVS